MLMQGKCGSTLPFHEHFTEYLEYEENASEASWKFLEEHKHTKSSLILKLINFFENDRFNLYYVLNRGIHI